MKRSTPKRAVAGAGSCNGHWKEPPSARRARRAAPAPRAAPRPPAGQKVPTYAQLEAELQRAKEDFEVERLQSAAEENSFIEAQQELEASRERYVELYDFAPVGYLSLDRNGQILSANRAAASLLGCPQEKLIGHPLMHRVAREDRRLLMEYLWRARRNRKGPPSLAEIRFQIAAGDPHTFELSGMCGSHSAKREGIRVTLTDVTERRRAEAELRASEMRFRTLANEAPVLIWTRGPDQGHTWFNEPWLEFTGRTLEQQLGGGWRASVHPDDLPGCLAACAQAFANFQEFRIEYRLRRHDGEWRWVLDHGSPLLGSGDLLNGFASGNAAAGPGERYCGFVGSCVDITERKQFESILHAKQAELLAVTDATPVMLTRCGRDLRYRFVNRSYAAVLGKAPEEVVGKPIRDILGPAVYDLILPHMKKVLAGEPVEYEAELNFPGAGPRYCHVAYTPDKGARGEVVGWVSAITDITERKHEEQRLRIRDAVSRELAEAPTLREAAPKVLQTLCERAGWDVGALWLANQAGQEMWCVDLWHHPALRASWFETETRRQRFAPGQGVPGRAWSTGQPQILSQLDYDSGFQRAAAAHQGGLRSGFCFPIRLGDKILGAIECYSREQRAPDTGLLNLLAALGDKLGQFIERKQAEAALRQSEERMRHILETALDAVITIACDGVITGWNPQAEQIFGWTAEEARGRKLAETIIPAQLREAYERGMQHYLDTGEGPMLEKRVEWTALHRRGHEFPVELAITPLVLEDRLSFGAFVRDITERKAAEEVLRRHVEEMAAANRDLKRFNRAAVGRELRMIELKQEINELCTRASLPPRYDLGFAQAEAASLSSPHNPTSS